MQRNPKGNRQELKMGYNIRKTNGRSKRFRLYKWSNKTQTRKGREERDHAPTACWRRFSDEGVSTARCSLREEEDGDGVVRSSLGVVRWPWWITEPEPEVERAMLSFSTGCSGTASGPMTGVKRDRLLEGPPEGSSRSSWASLKNSIGSSSLRRLMPVVVLALRME